MTGIELIAAERLEQKIKHNRSIKSDYELNPDFQIVRAAVAILTTDTLFWPVEWDEEVYKKIYEKPYEQQLVIAGALIAAEIDRLNYIQ